MPNSNYREDNKIIADCFTTFNQTGLGEFDIETDVEKVYEDFNVEGSDLDNIHPYTVFRFRTKSTRFRINKKTKTPC
jgi:hypothetical protein